MEFQPEGKVTLKLLRNGKVEVYTWNKVTSCIHNLLGAERWVDLYGESRWSPARRRGYRLEYSSSKRATGRPNVTNCSAPSRTQARISCRTCSGSGVRRCMWGRHPRLSVSGDRGLYLTMLNYTTGSPGKY